MIRLVFLLRRAPHLSLAEFQHYWRTTHGPLVASHRRRGVEHHLGRAADGYDVSTSTQSG